MGSGENVRRRAVIMKRELIGNASNIAWCSCGDAMVCEGD